MIPVFIKFDLTGSLGHLAAYLLALGIVVYAAWAGWRGAAGPLNPKTGEMTEPSRDDRIRRAAMFAVGGAALAVAGLYYALPNVPIIGKGKGEGIPIHTYGILVGGGFIAAVTVAAWLAKREWPGEEGEKKRDQIFDMAFYCFIGGLVGARVLFIIVNFKEFLRDPSPFGGLVFYGAFIGGVVAAFFYARKHQIEFLRLADVGIPTVSLAQSLGRLGCFAAGCCWGDTAKKGFPLAVHFPGSSVKDIFGRPGGTASLAFSSMRDDTRWIVEETGKKFHEAVPGAVRISDWVTQHGHTLSVHPTQLYESVGQLVLFVLLLVMRRYRRFHGQVIGTWLMAYAVLRSSVELFRGDVERGTLHGFLAEYVSTTLAAAVPLEAWYNLSVSQFISICMFSLGAVLIVRKTRGLVAAPALSADPKVA